MAPPTRRLFTSSTGRTFSTALQRGIGSPLVLRSISFSAWYTICSAVERLLACSTLLTELGDDDRPVDRVGHQLSTGAGPCAALPQPFFAP